MRSPRTFRLGVCLVAFLMFSGSVSQAGSADPADPSRDIQDETLPNGLRVYYAPSSVADTFKIKVRVATGFDAETPETSGIAHLVEHYLFTDASLPKDLTYLEVIKEKGGSTNGITSSTETTYYATIPPVHAQWMVETMGKMLLREGFDRAQLEHAKKPVLVEIGQPHPIDHLIATPLFRTFFHDLVAKPDFWAQEFGIKQKRLSDAHQRVNTLRFTESDAESFYRDYYHPINMTVYLAGRFDPHALGRKVRDLFGKSAPRAGQVKTLETPKPVPRDARYFRSSATSGTPSLSYGAKIWNIGPEDELTLRVYLEFLSHRLMKEIRNRQGGTYTAYPSIGLRENFGYASVSLQTAPEQFREILDYVKGLLRREAVEGGFTVQQFREARELYRARYQLLDRSTDTRMWLAEERERFRRAYGKGESSYAVFTRLEFEDFRFRLARLFREDRIYSDMNEPPVFFRLEYVILIAGFLIGVFFVARRWLPAPFDHAKVHWVRKVSFPPLKLLEGFMACVGVYAGFVLVAMLARVALRVELIQRSFILSDYLFDVLSVGIMVGGCMQALRVIPRKLILCGDQLYLKSITYGSTRLPLLEISSVDALTPGELLLPKHWGDLGRIRHRFHYFDPLFWRPGLLIRLRSGRSHFFSIRDATRARDELSMLLDRTRDSEQGMAA